MKEKNSQKEIENARHRDGRLHMADTLSQAKNEWARRQEKNKRAAASPPKPNPLPDGESIQDQYRRPHQKSSSESDTTPKTSGTADQGEKENPWESPTPPAPPSFSPSPPAAPVSALRDLGVWQLKAPAGARGVELGPELVEKSDLVGALKFSGPNDGDAAAASVTFTKPKTTPTKITPSTMPPKMAAKDHRNPAPPTQFPPAPLSSSRSFSTEPPSSSSSSSSSSPPPSPPPPFPRSSPPSSNTPSASSSSSSSPSPLSSSPTDPAPAPPPTQRAADEQLGAETPDETPPRASPPPPPPPKDPPEEKRLPSYMQATKASSSRVGSTKGRADSVRDRDARAKGGAAAAAASAADGAGADDGSGGGGGGSGRARGRSASPRPPAKPMPTRRQTPRPPPPPVPPPPSSASASTSSPAPSPTESGGGGGDNPATEGVGPGPQRRRASSPRKPAAPPTPSHRGRSASPRASSRPGRRSSEDSGSTDSGNSGGRSSGTWSKPSVWQQREQAKRERASSVSAAGARHQRNSDWGETDSGDDDRSSTRSSRRGPPRGERGGRAAAASEYSESVRQRAAAAAASKEGATATASGASAAGVSAGASGPSGARSQRLLTCEQRMPLKCCKVAREYVRVWLLLGSCLSPEHDWTSPKLARRVLNESEFVGKSGSAQARYRKLMRLVHPDALVALKGHEPTTAVTLVMASSLLRTFNSAHELVERNQESKANALAPPPCLASPGDWPKGAPPSAKKRNAVLSTHVFLLAEKLLADPNSSRDSSRGNGVERLTPAVRELRNIPKAHRAGLIADMLNEETKRAELEAAAEKAAQKRADLEAKMAKAADKAKAAADKAKSDKEAAVSTSTSDPEVAAAVSEGKGATKAGREEEEEGGGDLGGVDLGGSSGIAI